jgi:hypothetical protein
MVPGQPALGRRSEKEGLDPFALVRGCQIRKLLYPNRLSTNLRPTLPPLIGDLPHLQFLTASCMLIG